MNRLSKYLSLKVFLPLLLFPLLSEAQIKESQNEVKFPQFEFQGLFQARYLTEFSKGIDVATGLHHLEEKSSKIHSISKECDWELPPD